jgi:hypothetical protein
MAHQRSSRPHVPQSDHPRMPLSGRFADIAKLDTS